MPDPFERSMEAARVACLHLNTILENCAEGGTEPNQETVNGMTAALDALRNSEGKHLDRLNQGAVRNAKAVYS